MKAKAAQIRKLLPKLALQPRLKAWLDGMNRAGGMRFLEASEQSRDEVHHLVISTPEPDRTAFLDTVDAILGANAVICFYGEATWSKVETAMAKADALLGLAFLCRQAESDPTLAAMMHEAAGLAAVPGQRVLYPPAGRQGDADLARQLMASTALLIDQDTSGLGTYWREALGRRHGPSVQTNVEDLMAHSGDKALRAAHECFRRVRAELRVPLDMAQAFVGLSRTGDVALPSLDWHLPPVAGYLRRARDVNERLEAQGMPQPRASDRPDFDYTALARAAVVVPRWLPACATLILEYEHWLFPWRLRERLEADAPMACWPWQHRDRVYMRATPEEARADVQHATWASGKAL